jgi:hypothetical protein
MLAIRTSTADFFLKDLLAFGGFELGYLRRQGLAICADAGVSIDGHNGLISHIYAPGEIVDGRRSYSAETATDALHAAKAWIADGSHNATRLRVIDDGGAIILDRPLAETPS